MRSRGLCAEAKAGSTTMGRSSSDILFKYGAEQGLLAIEEVIESCRS